MVGMRDVAKEAGVSLSTVSLVVNKTGYVSDDMRARVKAAMKSSINVPNELARNLYKNRTNLVGVIRADHPPPLLCHPYRASATRAGRARTAHHAVLHRRRGKRRGRIRGHAAPSHDGRHHRLLAHHPSERLLDVPSTARSSPSTVCWAAASRRSAPTMSRAAGSWRTCWSTPARTTW